MLDPEQNHAFLDHYLDTEYSLADVMFIGTANVMHPVPAALKDRMEVLRLPGYTLNEKIAIGERYLVDKQMEKHGLTKKPITWTTDGIQAIVERYTKEAGVRNLEREIASLCRKMARKVVSGELDGPVKLDEKQVVELLGVPRYHLPSEATRKPEVASTSVKPIH